MKANLKELKNITERLEPDLGTSPVILQCSSVVQSVRLTCYFVNQLHAGLVGRNGEIISSEYVQYP